MTAVVLGEISQHSLDRGFLLYLLHKGSNHFCFVYSNHFWLAFC